MRDIADAIDVGTLGEVQQGPSESGHQATCHFSGSVNQVDGAIESGETIVVLVKHTTVGGRWPLSPREGDPWH